MKFGQHLLSHLTPEWREQYVAYEELKEMLYTMTKGQSTVDDETGLTKYTVNIEIQDKFFTEANKELQKVQGFYKEQEAKANFRFSELKRKATAYHEGLLQSRGRKRQWNHILHRHRDNVEVLRLAFREFYLNLILLQSYQKLNYTAFRKILKKHDKLAASCNGSKFFKENVHNNNFFTSDTVEKLIAEAENIFAVCLEGGEKAAAMKKLRVPPFGGKMSHWVTFRTGLFNGMIFVSIIVIVVATILHPSSTWPNNYVPYVSALRAGLLLVLALYGFATNTYVWRANGVNSTLIFEFDSRDYRSFTQLYEIASIMGILWIFCVCLFVFADWLGIPPVIGPSMMLLMFPGILFLPLPFFYWRSRLFLIKVLCRVVLAPFCEVTFADFWVADQLGSLGRVLLDVAIFFCLIALGSNNSGPTDETCGSVSIHVTIVLTSLPAWFRFAQCLRRWYDSGKVFPHFVNAGKYSTTFFVVLFSALAKELQGDSDDDSHSTGFYVALFLWITSAMISTCYTFTWDIKMDWGLFKKQFFFRDNLIYPKKIYYVIAVVEDLIFRSFWTLSFSNGVLDLVPYHEILKTVFAIFEVFRRFIWNFFRLEAEHLENVGEFRAVRDISLHPIELAPKDLDENLNSSPPQYAKVTETAI